MLWHRGSALSDRPSTAAPAPEPRADALASAAVEPIEPGMLVGLGAGRTAARGIRALADRVKRESLRIQCVAASERAHK